jgi:two-component system catabolic regulation response regulator CreB
VSAVLLIDDEPAITESLAFALGRAGFETETASSLAKAEAALAVGRFDLVILDLMLPDGNGLDWLRGFRGRSGLPVIILSSHDESVDHIVGLELGADDYVGKPFSPREVVARVRAVLRRLSARRTSAESTSLRLEPDRRQAWAAGVELGLSRTEFDLLLVFTGSPGRVYERGHLLTLVWGPDVAVTERTVDVHIKALRKKLVSAGLPAGTIETVRGVGYRLSEEG